MIPDDLLPEKYREFAFIAGGFAACPSLASDMDVWVMAPSEQLQGSKPGDLQVLVHLHAVRKELLEHLAASHHTVKDDTMVRVVEDHTEHTETEYMHRDHTIVKVATIYHRPEIHLLVTDAPNIRTVLDGFDISTHQVALTRTGIVRGCMWTPVNTDPFAIRDTPNTPERLKKITERYKHVNS